MSAIAIFLIAYSMLSFRKPVKTRDLVLSICVGSGFSKDPNDYHHHQQHWCTYNEYFNHFVTRIAWWHSIWVFFINTRSIWSRWSSWLKFWQLLMQTIAKFFAAHQQDKLGMVFVHLKGDVFIAFRHTILHHFLDFGGLWTKV